jgi:hypothetical protein
VAIDVAAGAVDPLGDEEIPGGPGLFAVELHAETRSPTKTTAITPVDTILIVHYEDHPRTAVGVVASSFASLARPLWPALPGA